MIKNRISQFYLFLAIFIFPGLVLGNSLEYGLKIREANKEFGTLIPKALCMNERRFPCRLPVYMLYDIVPDIKITKDKLSQAAYSALKRHAGNAQAVWEFNLCKPLWDRKQPCVEVLGYLVVKYNTVTFYTFQQEIKDQKK